MRPSPQTKDFALQGGTGGSGIVLDDVGDEHTHTHTLYLVTQGSCKTLHEPRVNVPDPCDKRPRPLGQKVSQTLGTDFCTNPKDVMRRVTCTGSPVGSALF
jgi:hypothetical protein